MGSGGNIYPLLIGNLSKNIGITGNTSGVIVGSPGYYITGITVSIPPNITGAGITSMIFSDSSFGGIFSFWFYAPAAAPNANQPVIITPGGFFWNNKTANSQLNLALGAAIAGGGLALTINYGLCAFVG